MTGYIRPTAPHGESPPSAGASPGRAFSRELVYISLAHRRGRRAAKLNQLLVELPCGLLARVALAHRTLDELAALQAVSQDTGAAVAN